jgi:cell division protein FtsL
MRWLLLLLIVGMIVSAVWQHLRVVGLGYEVERLRQERSRLEHRRQELTIERASLSGLDRVEHIATGRLGMRKPHEDEVRVVPLRSE